MKIIHTADLHLGSPLNTRLTPDKVKERKAELVATFERMADEAIYRGARVFIIAGDLFDSERVGKRQCERILNVIERTGAVDFLYLPGNHEKNVLSESGLPLPSNLKLFGADWTYFSYDGVTFSGRSEITADMFKTLKTDPFQKNVVVLHGALTDRCTGGDTVGIKDAEGLGIDYLALGHYHGYGAFDIDDRGTAVYCGTPEGRGFDEVGDKGFVVVNTDLRRVTHEFVPFAKRRLRWIKVDLSGAERRMDIEDAVTAALSRIPSSDMVRVELCGARAPELFVDTDSLEVRWTDSFYHFECRDTSRTLIDPEAYKYDKSLKGEFIRLCMAREDLSDEDKEAVIRTGLAALMGESTEV